MMDFAVVLYFDSDTGGKIQTLIKKIADGNGNTYMVDHAIPPHVTVAYFEKEIPDGLPELLEQVVPMIQSLCHFPRTCLHRIPAALLYAGQRKIETSGYREIHPAFARSLGSACHSGGEDVAGRAENGV
jgi:hypothetical protein